MNPSNGTKIIGIIVVCFFLLGGSAAAGTLTGIVTDESSNPIADTSITLSSYTAMCDIDGYYTLSVPDGTYAVQVTPPALSGFSSTVIHDVVVNGTVVLDIILVPIPTFVEMSGVVRDRDGTPQEGLELSMGGINVWTDVDGLYAFTVTPGSYHLLIEEGTNNNFTLPRDLRLFSAYFQLDADLIQDITLENVYLEVIVEDPFGNPIAGISVAVEADADFDMFPGVPFSNTRVRDSASTDASGLASIILLRTHSPFEITMTPPQGSSWAGSVVLVNSILADSTMTTVLSDNVTMSGVLRDRDGIPQAGVELTMDGIHAWTEEDGSYSINVPPGSQRLRIEEGDYSGTSLPNDMRLHSEYFLIEANMEQDLTLENVYMHITIQDAFGTPISDASAYYTYFNGVTDFELFPGVSLTSARVKDGSGGTNALGQATLSFLRTSSAGEITINSPYGGAFGGTTYSFASMQADTSVTITLPGLVTMSGVFRDRDGNPQPGLELKLDRDEAITAADGSYSMQVSQGESHWMEIEDGSNDGSNLPLDLDLRSAPILFNENLEQDITLENIYLSVRVQDIGGNPIPGASVRYNRYHGSVDFEFLPGIALSISRFRDGRVTDTNGVASLRFLRTQQTIDLIVTPPAETGFEAITVESQPSEDASMVVILQSSVSSVDMPGLETGLIGNIPNPFNPLTAISFSLEKKEHVRVSVFDMRGRQVIVLADRSFDYGKHVVDWNGTNTSGLALPSGTYFVRMETGMSKETMKIMLVR